ncbi:MAG: group 1 truncated hemoglobin [Pseudomonadota bacterium]
MNEIAMAAPSGTSMFSKYGGFAAVRGLVMDFYDRVLDSEIVGHHFDNVDMRRLVDHQTRFIAGLMGGPAELDEGRLARAHRHLGISGEEFEEIVDLLSQTLSAGGVAESDCDSVIETVERFRHDIVTERRP